MAKIALLFFQIILSRNRIRRMSISEYSLCSTLLNKILNWEHNRFLRKRGSTNTTSPSRRRPIPFTVHTIVQQCWHKQNTEYFTFSDPCIVIRIRDKDQQDAPFLINSIPIKLPSICFEQIIDHHQEVISEHAAYCILPCIYVVSSCSNEVFGIPILYAVCTQITSWWWANICSKQVEDIYLTI